MRPVTVAAVRVAPPVAPLTPAVLEANTARALALVEGWNPAELDQATAMSSLTPASSVPQPSDHLAGRNLALIRRHADALPGEAATPVPYRSANAG